MIEYNLTQSLHEAVTKFAEEHLEHGDKTFEARYLINELTARSVPGVLVGISAIGGDRAHVLIKKVLREAIEGKP